MSLLDVVIGLILLASIVAGWSAGFARVGIGFAAAVAGMVFGFWFYQTPAAWIHRYVSSTSASNFLGYFAIFLGCLLLGAILAKFVSMLFRWTGFSWLDRLLGAGFGAIRGAFIACAFVAVLLAFTPKPMPNWMVTSKLLPYAAEASNTFASIAPVALKNAFREGLTEIRKDWDEEVKRSQRKREPAKKTGKEEETR
jgi:membrane protein required for colicin V production